MEAAVHIGVRRHWAVDGGRHRLLVQHPRLVDRVLRELALGRGGVVTAEEIRRAGISRGRGRTLLRPGGDWVALRRGVYAHRVVVEHCAGDLRARHALATAAALAMAGPVRFAAGASAACVLGLETLGEAPERVTLSSPRPDLGAGPRGHGFRDGRGRSLVSHVPPEQLVCVSGLTCTGPARTAVDLTRSSALAAGVVAVDSAARQFGTPTDELWEVAALQTGWPFARRTERALGLTDARSESVLETLGRLSLRFTSLPPALSQVWLGETFPEVRVDLLIPGLGVVGEGDGRLKYTDPRALWEEKKRQERVEELGFVVVRFDWQEATMHPRRLAKRFEAAVDRARPGGSGRMFPDPDWWTAHRHASWHRARHQGAWWLDGVPC